MNRDQGASIWILGSMAVLAAMMLTGIAVGGMDAGARIGAAFAAFFLLTVVFGVLLGRRVKAAGELARALLLLLSVTCAALAAALLVGVACSAGAL
jgi:hypothetical protein